MLIPASTWRAYESTTFCATLDGIDIRIRVGQSNVLLDAALDRRNVTSWAYLTAWNPAGKVLSRGENDQRQARLIKELRAGGFDCAEGQGVPDDPSWEPENSLLVFGMDVTAPSTSLRAGAQRLGALHGQFAIAFGRRGRPAELLACRDAAITLTVMHPTIAPGPIQGFRFLWAFYVNGYRPEKHCQPGLRGRRVDEFSTGRASSDGAPVVLDRMDRYPYVYICGVGSGPKDQLRHKNLHMPLRFRPGSQVEMTAYNGYLFRAENAELIEIPELPPGWGGIADEQHTRCKNFRFAVGVFGAIGPARGDDRLDPEPSRSTSAGFRADRAGDSPTDREAVALSEND